MSRFTTYRDQVASLRRVAYRRAPFLAALGGLLIVALANIGERATRTRKRRITALSLTGMMVTMVAPAAAQSVGCGDGPLSFLAAIYSMITMSAGTIIVSMVILAGVLKMIPMRGTNSWGNALVSSVVVGILFLVVGPALIDLANPATPIQLNAQCT
jgi:hypothetical protein